MKLKIVAIALLAASSAVLLNTVTSYVTESQKSSDGVTPPQSRFRLVSKSDSGESASYVFHSSQERLFKTYDDCIGCPPYEDGDTQLYRQFMSKEHAEESITGYAEPDSDWEIVEPKSALKSGGFRQIDVIKDLFGRTLYARITWIEPTKRSYAYWFIEAPTVELAKEFEQSRAFREALKSIPPEPPGCETYGSNSANYDWCR
ncbi:MAG: hypothetical protein J5I65_04655 [Aridibacter famidurans]|nr:hypothetical protein [Aridibacter famidurans]